MIANRFLRIRYNSENKGVFNKIYTKDASFANFSCTTKGSSSSDESSITDDNKYWESENVPKPHFTTIFNRNSLVLSSFTFMSCIASSCVYNISIQGSNKGDSWENICDVLKEKRYFFDVKQHVECKSKFAYKMIRFVNVGTNMNGNYVFSIRHLDLYGDLYNEKPNIMSQMRCMRPLLPFQFVMTLLMS